MPRAVGGDPSGVWFDDLQPGRLMSSLHLYDVRNHLFLTGFYLPLRSSWASEIAGDGGFDQQAAPDDESVGQMLMVTAKQRTEPRLRPVGRDADDAGLQTWVLGPSPRGMGRLQDWFRSAQRDSRYRIAIHRTPRRYAGCALPLVWDEVYDVLSIKGASALRSVAVAPTALRSGVTALGEGLSAYPRGAEAVVTWADSLGHPYTLIV